MKKENGPSARDIETKVVTKATAQLSKDIEEELEKPDTGVAVASLIGKAQTQTPSGSSSEEESDDD